MAARATRSASHKARATEAVATGPLGALSHDELGVIVDGLADPLQPVVAVALSSTCLGLRTPLRAVLKVLKERQARAVALCRKMKMSCVEMRDAEELQWTDRGLTAADMATLGTILQTNGLPRLQLIFLGCNGFGDAGVQALCAGLGPGAAPSLRIIYLTSTKIGPAGAEAFAGALSRGAMPKLDELELTGNPIGNQGMAALAAPVRKLPALTHLVLFKCEIGDKGLASLVANLGKDDFKKLESLFLADNYVTDAGMITLAAALDAGRLTRLRGQTAEFAQYFLQGNPASASAIQAVKDALAKRSQ